MKTAAEITAKIIEEMYFRLLAHKVESSIYYSVDGINTETIKQLQEERQRIFDIRMSMLTISANMIMKGEF